MPKSTTEFPARKVITMDPGQPDTTAVAVSGGRISGVGPLEDLRDTGTLDDTFADAVLCPGLIDQRGGDWVMPDKMFPAAHSPQEYRQRLTAAEQALADPL